MMNIQSRENPIYEYKYKTIKKHFLKKFEEKTNERTVLQEGGGAEVCNRRIVLLVSFVHKIMR